MVKFYTPDQFRQKMYKFYVADDKIQHIKGITANFINDDTNSTFKFID